MRIKGLLLALILLITSVKGQELFKFRYLRLAGGSCVKCIFSTKNFNQVKDEYKPFIVFRPTERHTYQSDLEANQLSGWPAGKIIFADSLADRFPVDTFGCLYLTNDHKTYQQLSLNYAFDPDWLNIVFMKFNYTKALLPDSVQLSRQLDYYPYSHQKIIHNTQTKTIYQLSNKTLTTIVLTNRLKFKIYEPYLTDSFSRYDYLTGLGTLMENGIDPSNFGSITTYEDTLIVMANIGYIKFTKKTNRIMRHQFLCKFVDGRLVSSIMLKETAQHITYDEYEANDIFYRPDSLFIRCNKYDKKDRMEPGDHLALFVPKEKYYERKKLVNMTVPEYSRQKSFGMTDYTNGSFYQHASGPDYYYFKEPSVFQDYKNRSLPAQAFIDRTDTLIIISVMKLHDFTLMLAVYNTKPDVHRLYVVWGDEIIWSDMAITNHENPVRLYAGGISAIDGRAGK